MVLRTAARMAPRTVLRTVLRTGFHLVHRLRPTMATIMTIMGMIITITMVIGMDIMVTVMGLTTLIRIITVMNTTTVTNTTIIPLKRKPKTCLSLPTPKTLGMAMSTVPGLACMVVAA
jgi:hypothetical protein